MNKLETLPKILSYDGNDYFLRIHVNFRGNLVIGYHADNDNELVVYVVEPQNEPYIPKNFVTNNTTWNENIGNMRTLDECIDQIAATIKEYSIKIKDIKKDVELEINQILTSIFDDAKDNQKVTDAILDDVITDIEETADSDFNDCDIKIAVGRVLKQKLGVDE